MPRVHHCPFWWAACSLATGKLTEVSPLTAWQCSFAFQDDWTPLHCAASEGHTAAAEVLLNRGASVDAVTKVGLRAAVLPDAASMPRCADPDEEARRACQGANLVHPFAAPRPSARGRAA